MSKPILAAALAATMLATPAVAQRVAIRDWPLAGRGVPLLLPPLRNTIRGHEFVMRHFDWNHDGLISPREADAANRAFAAQGWDGPPPPPPGAMMDGPGVPPPPPPGPGGWDRGALHGYGFRQVTEGARFALGGDVLFQTDSDVLRPGAVDRLKPLANYLRANPGVRVAIDGYTDSRGTPAHNQDLSERRAASVRAAFDAMGVTQARFRVAGHGEGDPVATNATPDGMRQNRRVEVTLLGRRASEF